MRTQIEQRSKANGRSMMAECEALLEREMALEDAMGGSIRELLRQFLHTFTWSGEFAARMLRHPDWGLEEWMVDAGCYEAAALAVVRLLWRSRAEKGFHPAPTRDAIEKWLDRLTESLSRDITFLERGEEQPIEETLR